LILQERDINNRVLVTYTRGRDLSGSIGGAGGIGGLLGRTDANGSAFYHADCLGNVTALINSSNILVGQYLYGPFGEVIAKWGPYQDLNEMQFSSMPRHSLSGFSMYLYRVYDPILQRWVSRDPIGECGGVNLYRMNNNNPIDEIDPLGLDNMYGAVSGGTWNNNVPNVTLSMNPIVTPVYHPSIPVLTAAGEEPVSVPPGYTEYVPTGAFQLTTTYNGTDPNSVIMMIAAGYFLGDAAGEGLGAMGGAGFRLFTKCADFTKTGVEVTEANIAKALNGSTMKTAQGAVSQPAVERYVRQLEAGKVPPPISVDGNVIVDGNHRYVAGRLVGTEPPTTPGTLSPSQAGNVQPIQNTTVDPTDWGNH
jgi:RHS repeat-associated protein